LAHYAQLCSKQYSQKCFKTAKQLQLDLIKARCAVNYAYAMTRRYEQFKTLNEVFSLPLYENGRVSSVDELIKVLAKAKPLLDYTILKLRKQM